jgi:hypothetical protein
MKTVVGTVKLPVMGSGENLEYREVEIYNWDLVYLHMIQRYQFQVLIYAFNDYRWINVCRNDVTL